MWCIFQISQLITENQELRKLNLKIKHNLEDAMDKFEMIFGEKVDLENFAEALQVNISIDLYINSPVTCGLRYLST